MIRSSRKAHDARGGGFFRLTFRRRGDTSAVAEAPRETRGDTTMFKRLYIDNYKSLVNFDLPLQELTLLVGPNGAGKSAVLEVVCALRELIAGRAKVTDEFPSDTLTRWQSRNRQIFEFEVDIAGDELSYRMEIEHQIPTEKARITLESLTANRQPLFVFRQGKVHLFRDDHSEGPVYSYNWTGSALAHVLSGNDNRRLSSFRDFVSKTVICGIYPRDIKAECKMSNDDTTLDWDAQNFSAWYQSMHLERPDGVERAKNDLREVIDRFNGMRLEKTSSKTRRLLVSLTEGNEDCEFGFNEISDGQRALIVLHMLLRMAGDGNHTLFLDEPDNYVALREIQPWLIELEDSCGDSMRQAVLCSHHPELIDYLGNDRGLTLRRESSGVTRVGKLAGITVEGGITLSEIVARGWEQ